MYPMAPEYSEARWLEKCSTLIGSGTAAWAFIFRQRGHVRHSITDLQRGVPHLAVLEKPIFPELLISSFS